MSTLREEIHRLVESLAEEDLPEVRAFVRVLLKGPEDLTEEEQREVEAGEAEVKRGEWVWWEDIKRTDV